VRTNSGTPNHPKAPAFPGYHTRPVVTEKKPFDANHQVRSIFKSHHSPEQKHADASMIAALIGPGIMQRDHHTGGLKKETEMAFFPSRTRLEPVESEPGQPTYQIVGGWVTRQEAIAELSEPESVVVELPASQPIEQAA